MDWSSDDEFEAFLRRFQPSRPKALPTRRRAPVGLAIAAAIAAVIVAAVVIPTWYGSKGPAANDSTEAPASTPSGRSAPADVTSQGGPPDLTMPTGVEERMAAGAASRRVRVGGAIKPPRLLVRVDPIYPEDAQAAGIQGIVVLECVIGEDGSVIETWVSHSIPELDQAAIAAVSQWVYETTLLNGEPVEVEMSVTINFTLSEAHVPIRPGIAAGRVSVDVLRQSQRAGHIIRLQSPSIISKARTFTRAGLTAP